VENIPVKCHSLIVGARCKYLKNLMDTTEGTIHLPQTPHAVFLLLLKFLYTASLDEHYKHLASNLKCLAEVYQLNELSSLAGKLSRNEVLTAEDKAIAEENLRKDIHTILHNKSKSDVTFAVQGIVKKKFYLHKLILETRSEYFSGLLNHNWKENVDSKHKYAVTDMSSEVFESLIDYLYSDQLPRLNAGVAGELLVVANKYNLTRLKQICENAIQPELQHCDKELVLRLYFDADLHLAEQLKTSCLHLFALPQWYSELHIQPEFLGLDPAIRQQLEKKYTQSANILQQKDTLEKKLQECEKELNSVSV